MPTDHDSGAIPGKLPKKLPDPLRIRWRHPSQRFVRQQAERPTHKHRRQLGSAQFTTGERRRPPVEDGGDSAQLSGVLHFAPGKLGVKECQLRPERKGVREQLVIRQPEEAVARE
jgi:hypothetical protein